MCIYMYLCINHGNICLLPFIDANLNKIVLLQEFFDENNGN